MDGGGRRGEKVLGVEVGKGGGGGSAGGCPHLQHGDLHLVVAVRGVGGRDDEEAAFLVELIQQAGGRAHGCVDLHGWG